MISYLGHSAATKLDFNVESVYAYSNRKNIMVFLAMGLCGIMNRRILSEDYNLAPERGSVIYFILIQLQANHDTWNLGK